jgi:hypothetical protein
MVKPIIQINNIRSQGDFRYLQIHNEPNSQSRIKEQISHSNRQDEIQNMDHLSFD